MKLDQVSQMQNRILTFLILLACTIFSLLPKKLVSQNLLPNPSFNDVNTCCVYDASCSPEGWRLVKNRSLYFKRKGEEPYKNKNLVKIRLSSENDSSRDYLQAKLLCPLKKGKDYVLSLTVKPQEFAVNHIDVTFAEKMTCVERYTLFDPDTQLMKSPKIQFRNDDQLIYERKNLFNRESKWVRLKDTFSANGDEQFMIIGNLLPIDSLIWARIRNNLSRADYWIDQIEVEPLQGKATCNIEKREMAIYNNDVRHYCYRGSCGRLKTKFLEDEGSDNTDTLILEKVNFETGESKLQQEAYPMLDSVFRYLKEHQSFRLKIHGHTDERGNEQLNDTLSLNRAQSVKEYLAQKGVKAARMTCKGFGSTRPVKSNNRKSTLMGNRRVELIIVKNK